MKLKLIALTCLSWATLVRGQGSFIWDQQATGFVDGFAVLNNQQPLGQPFTPSFSSMDVAAFYLNGVTTSSEIEVNLRSGSISGTILGTSAPLTIGSSDSGVFYFLFSDPITLSPGTQYFLQPVAVTGVADANLIDAANSSGSAIYGGVTHSGFNFWFQEGITAIPEPSPVALGGMIAALVSWRYYRTMRDRTQKNVRDENKN